MLSLAFCSNLKMPKTRKERRRKAREAFLNGKARRSHVNKRDIRRSFEEEPSVPSASGDRDSVNERPSAVSPTSTVCSQCAPVLNRYMWLFELGLVCHTTLCTTLPLSLSPTKFYFILAQLL